MKKGDGLALKNWIVVTVAFVVSFVIILGVSIPDSYEYVAGDICESDIFAPREIEDTATTTRRREAAAAQVEPQYKINYNLNEDLVQKLQKLFATIAEARSMDMAVSGKIGFVREDIEIALEDEYITNLITMDATELSEFSRDIREIFSTTMDSGVSDINESVISMNTALSDKGMKGDRLSTAMALLSKFTKVNEEYDNDLTKTEKKKAMELIEPTVYKKNQIILRRGEVISNEQIELLSGLGLLKGSYDINKKYALGIFMFMLASYGIAAYYIRAKKRFSQIKTEKLVLLLVLSLVMLITVMFSHRIAGMYIYLIPLPISAILTATFIDMRMSSIMNIYIAFAACIMLGQSEEYIIAMVIFSTLGAMIFKRVSGLSGYARAMLMLAVAGGLSGGLVTLIAGKPIDEVAKIVLIGAINGLATSVIVIGTTPVFENIFDICTPFKLNDLGNPEKPILKRLMFEAPGTYHHSLMVGNLAEAACIRIGANNQLARVAAYYHDIGKLKRPDYFVENQIGDNPHDLLMPTESAEILRGHVSGGIEIAKQYRLPGEIKDIIAQHHGTTLTGIFYKKEREINPNADESNFKYYGPKPESKEAGIVMLADSCEAAVRSLDEKTEENIRAMVTKIVKGRMTDGQLDMCKLSFKELGEIIDAFVTMLGSYFHKRIKYDSKENENEPDNRKNS